MENKHYDYIIEHQGVKGQKWGVRRALTSTGHIIGSTAKGASKELRRGASTAGKAISKGASAAGKAIGSGTTKAATAVKMKTKASMAESAEQKNRGKNLEKKLRNTKKITKMSEEEIRKYTERLNLENTLQRLSQNSDRKSKNAYKQRVTLSDAKLREINSRLQMEENLKNQLSTAKKNNGSLELGKHATSIIANTSISLLKKQLNKEKGDKVLASDIVFEALKANAKYETTQTIKSANAPKYKKEFMGIVNDEVWKIVDKATGKPEDTTTKKPEDKTTKKPNESLVVETYSKKKDDEKDE